jgi:hypothetical protein
VRQLPYAVCIGEIRYAHGVVVNEQEEMGSLNRLCMHMMLISELVFKKYD